MYGNASWPPQLRKAYSFEALCRQHGLGREPRSKKHGAIYQQTVRGLHGIVGIEYEPHYCQYGWTALSKHLSNQTETAVQPY